MSGFTGPRIDRALGLLIYGNTDFSKTPKGMRCLGRIMVAEVAAIMAVPGARRRVEAAAVHAVRAVTLPISKTFSIVDVPSSAAACPVGAG
ncbi:hypothetical protein D3C87_1622080 [compost metagenome]